MKKSIVDLNAELDALRTQARGMVEDIKAEKRMFNADEDASFKTLTESIQAKEEEIRQAEATQVKPQTTTKNTRKMSKKNFSLLKAINDIANNRSLDEAAQAVVNAGAADMRASGQSYSGQIQIPVETRATITVGTEHDDVVEVDMADLLTPLRAKNVLVNAGAKYMTGLVGDVQVPIMGAGSVTWEDETGANNSDAGIAFTSKKLQPKRLTAYIDVSKQFLVQDSIGAEQAIRADLINAINTKLEATILGTASGGSGTNHPAGMLNGATISYVEDFGDICDLEASVEDANVLGQCKYICSNKAKAALRTMQKAENNGGMVMEAGEIDGTPVFNTSNVSNQYIVYGDFSNLAIGQWGAIDLTVDPYSQAKNGLVRIVVNAYFDAVVLRANAFAYGTTLSTDAQA